MRIRLVETGPDDFALKIGATTVPISRDELKALMLEAVQALSGADSPCGVKVDRFLDILGAAEDPDIQGLFAAADHHDVLCLLKAAEENDALSSRLSRNMSDKSRRICREDISFQFKDGLPEDELAAAFGRLRGVLERVVRERHAV